MNTLPTFAHLLFAVGFIQGNWIILEMLETNYACFHLNYKLRVDFNDYNLHLLAFLKYEIILPLKISLAHDD